jgi:Concanavalin A-like lectin/glucanases superfamily
VSLNAVPATTMTAISQDGDIQSNFLLGARMFSGVPKWSFSMQDADSATAVKFTHAYSASAIVEDDIGAWVHLVGVYDASTQSQRLYVDGRLAMTSTRSSRWQADGAFNVGCARYASVNDTTRRVDMVKGSVDAVRVYAGVLTPDMVNRLYQTQDGQL